MGVKVYGIPMSTATRNVMMALMEKDVDFELVTVDMKNLGHKKPEHLAMNPFGKVPVYQDDDVTLFESRAINRYIASKYEGQGTPLLGSTPAEQALVQQWMEVEGQNYYPPIGALITQLFFNKIFKGEGPDEAIVEVNEAKFNDVLDVYEARLSESKYLAGDFFSLADICHLAHTEYFMAHTGKADLINSRKHVAAWWKDISTRPTWKKVTSYGQ
ncbi:hypothetical protein Mapa_000765 [Marchantia paleacea]|nr:hypothetical protein Mapa_000765 [Marchantia paleacea]